MFGTDPHKLHRAEAPDTSVEAAYAVDTTALEEMVFDAIASFGEAGCISDEVRDLFDLPYSSITARYRALLDKGLIEVIGKRVGNSGRQQRIMREKKGGPEMATIPKPMNTTSEAIIRWWDQQADEPRPHLGASEIGKPCSRALWYSFRWASAKQFDGRMKRLFNRGHREEPQFLADLRAIGAEVYEVDPDTKQQYRFSAVNGHFGGSCDAIGRGLPEGPKTWAVVEFKTHGEKSFKVLQSNGVKEAKPEHYAQMQVYMGLAELERALYLAVNKNTDELWSEWIHFDKTECVNLLAKAQAIINAEEPPEKLSQDPAWYQCKFCDHQAICHGEQVPQKNCRTCVHASPVYEGEWSCASQNRHIVVQEQRLGCRSHLFIPPLINWAEPLDAGSDWIKYRDRSSGVVFANVTDDADRSEENMTNDIVMCLTSDELPLAVRKIINDQLTAELKKEFPHARIVGSSNTGEAPF